MAKKVDLKAKQKKQKILAAVLGVLFLGVAGFMGPKTFKQLTGPKEDPLRVAQEARAAASTTTGPTSVTPPSLAPATASADLASAAPTPIDQLTSFSRFESKDPFVQQVTPSSGAGSSPLPSASDPTSSGGSASSPPPPPAPQTPAQPKAPTPQPTAAVISVNNGAPQLVHPGDDFPLAPYEAIFHLVALRPGVAKIAIAGGSYTSGAATVTLKKGKPLTLENTADGTRYVVRLLWTGAGAPPEGLVPAPGATTTTSAPVDAPSTTSTTTTTSSTTTTTLSR
jgi:hypothetical protein